jgi:hypothetical protein
MSIIAFQPELSPALPEVIGNVDYLEFKKTLKRIDGILILTGIEERYVEGRLDEYDKEQAEKAEKNKRPARKLTGKNLERFVKHSVQALRCQLARELTGEGFRPFSCRLADSPLFQWFCRIDRFDKVRVPTKSSLDRYDKQVSEELIRDIKRSCYTRNPSSPEKDAAIKEKAIPRLQKRVLKYAL